MKGTLSKWSVWSFAMACVAAGCGGADATATSDGPNQAATRYAPPRVVDADEKRVRHCEYLGDVRGTAAGPEGARFHARDNAGLLGATHVVFVSESPGRMGEVKATAMGRAYRCWK
jgi:hypothetical protein